MVDRGKTFSLISSWDHCQRSSPSRISDMLQAGFEPAQNSSSCLVEWSCAAVIMTTPWHHLHNYLQRLLPKYIGRHQQLRKTFPDPIHVSLCIHEWYPAITVHLVFWFWSFTLIHSHEICNDSCSSSCFLLIVYLTLTKLKVLRNEK